MPMFLRIWFFSLLAAASLFLTVSAGSRPDSQTAPARDWPLFRGDPGQTGVASSLLPDPLAVLWKFQAKGSFESAAAIVGGTVYAGNYDDDGNLYALNLADGKVKWQQKVGPIKGPPSVAGGAVYVGTEDGILFCLDAAKGTKRWSFETGAEITGGANFAGDKILFTSYDSFLYCLNPSGKLLWKVKTQGPINGSPTVAGRRTFVAGCDSHLHVLDVDKGGKVRSVDLEGQVGATPAALGDVLYLGTMTDLVKAVDWRKGQVLWSYQPAKQSQGFYSSAAVTDKVVVVGARDRMVHALDRQTGKRLWTFATRGKVDASPVVAGPRVYAASFDGNLYVLDLAKGKQLQKLPLGESIAASPAVAEGRLVLGTTDGVLYCLGKKR
jgi:outer membrane protein assembly factor BamB